MAQPRKKRATEAGKDDGVRRVIIEVTIKNGSTRPADESVDERDYCRRLEDEAVELAERMERVLAELERAGVGLASIRDRLANAIDDVRWRRE